MTFFTGESNMDHGSPTINEMMHSTSATLADEINAKENPVVDPSRAARAKSSIQKEDIRVEPRLRALDRESLEQEEDKDSDISISVVTWNLAEESPVEEKEANISSLVPTEWIEARLGKLPCSCFGSRMRKYQNSSARGESVKRIPNADGENAWKRLCTDRLTLAWRSSIRASREALFLKGE